jgi:ProP effector
MTTHNAHSRAEASISVLAEAYPAAFQIFEQRRKPLKLGIHHDVALAGIMSARQLKNALRFYVGNAFYLRSLRKDAPRVDLEGKAVGSVTAEEEAAAQVRLARLHKPKPVKIAPQPKAAPQPPKAAVKVAPKPVVKPRPTLPKPQVAVNTAQLAKGLAALKAAAKQRKARA